MARYTDIDEVLKHQRKVKCFGISGEDECWDYAVLTEDIKNTPIANVVPKSEVAVEIIDEFKQIAKQFVLDRDLYLVTFKNALEYAESELKKKYVEKTNENHT
jgi:hypothetical protein